MAKTYLLLGSNLGERFLFLNKAIYCIEKEIGSISSQSSIYESTPWGFEHKNYFLNQVLVVNTKLNPNELLNKIHTIEEKIGRIRKSEQYSERNIDIDILFYNDLILNEENLTIPHPRICERMFTLDPLNEISPDLLHPIENKTITQIKAVCKDKLPVTKILTK